MQCKRYDVWQAEPARLLLEAVPPGSPRLITTRSMEVARQLRCEVRSLEALPIDEAVELLAKLLGGLGEQRSAARRVAELAGGLPLALEIAAGVAESPARLPLLVEDLETRSRVKTLALGKAEEDSVEKCFSLSYETLEAEDQRRFRALGAFAEAPFDQAALAAVWGEGELEPAHLRVQLSRNLLRRAGGGQGFRQHGLLRSYASDLVSRANEEQVVGQRHVEHYQHLVSTAPWQGVDAAYEQVRAAWRTVAKHPASAPAFALAAVRYQLVRGRWEDRRAWLEVALEHAQGGSNRALQGRLLAEVGLVYYALGKKEKALRRYEEALAVRREVGDRGGEGPTLNNIAAVHDALGRKDEALRRYEEALAVLREVGDRWGETVTLFNLGLLLEALDRGTEAVAALEDCVNLEETLGHPDLENDRAELERLKSRNPNGPVGPDRK